MKKSKILFGFLVALVMLACNKPKCDHQPNTCADRVPQDELCQAYFTRWFYDDSSNKCEEIGYSGCSQKGFATKAECEECKCK